MPNDALSAALAKAKAEEDRKKQEAQAEQDRIKMSGEAYGPTSTVRLSDPRGSAISEPEGAAKSSGFGTYIDVPNALGGSTRQWVRDADITPEQRAAGARTSFDVSRDSDYMTNEGLKNVKSASGEMLFYDETGKPISVNEYLARGGNGLGKIGAYVESVVPGADVSLATVSADSDDARRILAGHEASKRGELDAYMTEAGGKVNKQITPAMVEAAQALAKQSLGRFQDKNSPLSADVLKPTLNRQDALMQQMQAARKKESIAQLQAATSMGRNVQQAGVNAGRGALSSRAALAQLAGQQSQAAGAQGAGVLQEQMNARQAMQGLSNQMRGSGDAAVKASQQAMLQQRQNALANYAARNQAGFSAQQSRKQLEVNNLLRAYKMSENDKAKQADILAKIMGAIGTGVQVVSSLFSGSNKK